MSTSRRRFLKSGAMATLFAGVYCGSPKLVFGQQKNNQANTRNFEVPYEAKTDPVFYFTKSTFDPHLKTDFRVQAGTITTTLTLVEVLNCAAPKTKAAHKTSGECFSLLFKADRELSSVQTIYKLEHAALGKFSLFVERVAKQDDADNIYYEAIINRIQAVP